MKDEILFPEGGWQLNERARMTLSKLAPTLRGLQQTRIVVNGYTDNVPIGPELRRLGVTNNLDLSSKRADTVVTYLQSQGVNPNIISAKGFGDTHQVAGNGARPRAAPPHRNRAGRSRRLTPPADHLRSQERKMKS